ncbi:MAG: sigma-E processing peptidase SpoIIGA [Clostridiales bacterium]|nr:sigma-E processing peptidase SpoIIGA [Clostridiales bacterium]
MLQDYVIYADVLFLLNFVLDVFLLWATAGFLRVKAKAWRLLLAGLCGAFYGFGLVFPALAFLYSLPMVIAFSLLLIRVAFPYSGLPHMAKTAGVLYLIGFAMAGAALGGQALLSGWQSDDMVKWGVLIFSLIMAYVLARWGMGQFRRNWRKESFKIQVEIGVAGQKCSVAGLIDTGNDLCDPVSGRPAIIAEYDALRPLLPYGLCRIIEAQGGDDPTKVMMLCRNENWRKRLRLVPFSSIGNSNGLLLAFKPDKVVVHAQQKIETAQVVVCLYHKKIGRNSGCRAIINPAILSAPEASIPESSRLSS